MATGKRRLDFINIICLVIIVLVILIALFKIIQINHQIRESRLLEQVDMEEV